MIASGGVARLADLEALAALHISGVIVGKAFYIDAINTSAALALESVNA